MSKTAQEEPRSLATEQQAREVAEAAREDKWDNPSFLKEIFLGNLRMHLIDPFPMAQQEDRPEFTEFFEKMKKFLIEEVDIDEIEENSKIPQRVIDGLAELGAFGMKIKKQYGGLGFSQSEYNRILELVNSHDGSLVALLSAHQSIGVPQPLQLFGTDEQKSKYLPLLAKGVVSAFALTEPYVGSDPANLSTNVEETEEGDYILSGEKLWCTNGTIAGLFVVMARHKSDGALSAFIVERDWEGVKVEHRCHFMGLKGIENGVITFKNVKVPKENLLWKKGRGLKLALITLNTGRLSLPAAAVGAAKACLETVRCWTRDRIQWGKAISKHESISQKVADIAAATFAMEAISKLSTSLMEKGNDVRLESSVDKMYVTELGWKIIDDTLQIRGGRGYETSKSLKERGEIPIPIEKIMRDFRINLIFEGSSEIMRLFIAREAVDKHFSVAKDIIDPKKGLFTKLMALPKIGLFYAWWYPTRWIGWGMWPRFGKYGKLAKHVRFIDRTARKLARQTFHGMALYQAALERKQAFLFRIVDIGTELYAMSASITYAHHLAQQGNKNAANLADLYCSNARRHIKSLFKALWSNDDAQKLKISREIVEGQHTWMEEGIVGLQLKEGEDLVPRAMTDLA